MNNYSPDPKNDGTPNYYQGGIPPVPTESPNPDLNNPYTNPHHNPAQPSNPLPNNPYSQPQYTAPQAYGVQQQPNSVYANHAYSPNPYQQQAYAMTPQTPTNKNAIISLVASLVTLFILCGIPVLGTIAAIVGIVFGHKALKETEEVPNSGHGMAIAGTICGYAALLASILVSAFVVLLVVASIAGSPSGL
jgi:hypothetical protein